MQMTSSQIILLSLLPSLFSLIEGSVAQLNEPDPKSSAGFEKAKGLATGVIIAIVVGEFRSTAFKRPTLMLASKVSLPLSLLRPS